MMCYYLNVQFQGQRVKMGQNPLRPMMEAFNQSDRYSVTEAIVDAITTSLCSNPQIHQITVFLSQG